MLVPHGAVNLHHINAERPWSDGRCHYKPMNLYRDRAERPWSVGKCHLEPMNIYHTVESRYLELGYLEFCETQSIFLNKKYILIAFSDHNLALETFLQVKITRSANWRKQSKCIFDSDRSFEFLRIRDSQFQHSESRLYPIASLLYWDHHIIILCDVIS